MPAQELGFRRQKAVLWEQQGYDINGEPTVLAGDPVELRVIWNDKRSSALDPMGNKINLDADVVTNRDVRIGSVMWQGSLQDLEDLIPGTGTSYLPAADLTTLYRVVSSNVTPDLKNRASSYDIGLKRIKDAPFATAP